MIILQIHCAQCGRSHPKEFQIDLLSQITPEEFKKLIEAHYAWRVQFNGDQFDTYCSALCAK